jgi:hypothetical protein
MENELQLELQRMEKELKASNATCQDMDQGNITLSSRDVSWHN